MKIKEFEKIWPDIKDKKVSVLTGYRSPRWVTRIFTHFKKFPGDVYLLTGIGHEEITIRTIRELKII